MKRLSILAVFMLISVITFAQQALWGSQNIISPEIHPDNTVTCLLYTSDAADE